MLQCFAHVAAWLRFLGTLGAWKNGGDSSETCLVAKHALFFVT